VLSPDQVRHRLRAGRLEPVRRGVYRIAGTPVTWQPSLLAACLAVPGAMASFRSAAALFGLDGFPPDVLEITVPGRRRTRLEGVIVHDSVVAGPEHASIATAIPVTSVARTLCDLTGVVPNWTVERAVDEARRRKLVTLGTLRVCSRRSRARGGAGAR
jgi:predicted transcriptional regulator of viral defense system